MDASAIHAASRGVSDRTSERPSSPDEEDSSRPAVGNLNFVVIGRIQGPHGVAGELRIRPYTETVDVWRTFPRVVLRRSDRDDELRIVEGYRPHKALVLLKLKGVHNRDQAQALAGVDVLVRREWLPAADADEYYWADLIGLVVEDPNGREVGRVRAVLRPGADDLLVLEHQDREILVPFRAEIITEVDLAGGRIRIDPPEGLLDL
jgi:16S rRNA processing protein RimM